MQTYFKGFYVAALVATLALAGCGLTPVRDVPPQDRVTHARVVFNQAVAESVTLRQSGKIDDDLYADLDLLIESGRVALDGADDALDSTYQGPPVAHYLSVLNDVMLDMTRIINKVRSHE